MSEGSGWGSSPEVFTSSEGEATSSGLYVSWSLSGNSWFTIHPHITFSELKPYKFYNIIIFQDEKEKQKDTDKNLLISFSEKDCNTKGSVETETIRGASLIYSSMVLRKDCGGWKRQSQTGIR